MTEPRKAVNYVLPDGVTVLPVRYLTPHADDKAALMAFYETEHLANATVIATNAVTSATDSDGRKKANKRAVALRIERNESFAGLVKELAGGMDAAALEKVVNQCGERELDEIMEICRTTPDWAERQIKSLTNNQPVGMLNSLLDLLVKSEAGKQLLRDTFKRFESTLDIAAK